MANFARSLKSPSYLSPRLRPGMPGRTLSASSDVSVSSSHNSPRSEYFGDTVSSGRNTPAFILQDDSRDSKEGNEDAHPGVRGANDSDSSRPTTPLSRSRSRSRPIAIELPQLKRFSTAPARTPPEPVSARGDVQGGYFPFHEDPSTRVRRSHPFQRRGETKVPGQQSMAGAGPNSSGTTQSEHCAAVVPQGPPVVQYSSTPVSSYLAPGFHDHPLPMGKYYPSNYEKRHGRRGGRSTTVAGVRSGGGRSVSYNVPASNVTQSSPVISDSDAQRRLQQYQRDMIAHASMATDQLTARRAEFPHQMAGGMSLKDVWLTTRAALRPVSPRLAPLGSPGPVTPMELESSGGGYLSKGGPETLQAADGLLSTSEMGLRCGP